MSAGTIILRVGLSVTLVDDVDCREGWLSHVEAVSLSSSRYNRTIRPPSCRCNVVWPSDHDFLGPSYTGRNHTS